MKLRIMLVSLALTLTGCNAVMGTSPEHEKRQAEQYERLTDTWLDQGLYKTYDREEGVVCYIYANGSNPTMACMVAKPGDNQ